MDSIRLTGIRAAAGQGGSPSACSGHDDAPRWRDLRADVTVTLDLREAIAGDDITQTVDYAQLTDRVRQVMVAGAYECALVETIAGRIAQAVLLSHRVHSVDVALHAGHPHGADIDEIVVNVHRMADDDSRVGATPAAQASGLVPRQVHDKRDGVAAYGVATYGVGERGGDAHAGDPLDGGRHSDSKSGVPSGHANPTQSQVQQPSHAVIAMRGGSRDGEHLMRAAVVALDSVPGNQVTGISPLYHVSAIDGPDSMSAVVLVDTRLDLAALSHLLASINDKHRDTLALHAVTMRSDAEDGRHEQVGWQEAKTKASILAPWMDIEPDARFDGDPLSYLLALAPDATQVGMLSDRWILGGMQ